ncbi:MAG: S8 family serine peptidase [Chloroflexota bacterium]|nr:S8 family serine peptidase [Chloroflexota bacterium]
MVRVRLRVTAFTALVLVFGFLFPVGALATTPPPASQVIEALDPFARDHVPGSLLVALTTTTAPTVRLSETDTLVHLAVATSYEERTSPTEERETYARLLADPRVASVEPNYRIHMMQVPNDPFYGREYWTRSVNLEPAWDITTGSPNVIIGIIDAGVYAGHPDLKGRLLPGFNFVDNTSSTSDDSPSQHGTIVSVLAAGRGNDGVGEAGVAWGVKILPIKVINSVGDGNSIAVANGIHWAVDHGATVINLSLGGPDFSQSVAREISYARSRNISIVAAAGNEPTERDYPADDQNVITVGASDENNNPASFTSVVNKVDVAAPGVNIAMYLPEKGADLYVISGTSFSAPIVSGIIALMQSVKPGLKQEEALTALKNTARDIGTPGPDPQSGAGLVNAAGAVKAVQGTALSAQQSGSLPYTADYNRYDGPVLSGVVKRGFIWGPQVNSNRVEAYADAPSGQRQVWYFDKGRLELNNPQTGQITSGLLVNELVTGQVQTGDAARENRTPAAVTVAGDAGVPGAITYSTLNGVRAAAPRAISSPITEQLQPDGTVRAATSGDATGVMTAAFIKETNHAIASVFWQYLNSTGPTIQNGQTVNGSLFDPTFFVVGLPITEAYWTNATVGGVAKTVLVQAFERRVLTYTPSNPDPFKVEMGNVGQHYIAWRYGEQ